MAVSGSVVAAGVVGDGGAAAAITRLDDGFHFSEIKLWEQYNVFGSSRLST